MIRHCLVSGILVVLVSGLAMLWCFGVPKDARDKIDAESFVESRMKSAVAILVMITVLGVVTLIAPVESPPDQSVTANQNPTGSSSNSVGFCGALMNFQAAIGCGKGAGDAALVPVPSVKTN